MEKNEREQLRQREAEIIATLIEREGSLMSTERIGMLIELEDIEDALDTDAEIRERITDLEQAVTDQYHVVTEPVVGMWRRNGVACLQVADGDFFDTGKEYVCGHVPTTGSASAASVQFGIVRD